MSTKNQEILISIVSPVYHGEKSIAELSEKIIAAVEPLGGKFEIIFVEDCSPDQSWAVVESLCQKDNRIIGIKLSRNFGQHAAVTAGLEAAKGKYVVIIDCDLQDDPRYIPELYAAALQGNDVVYTRLITRAHSFLRNSCAQLFYAVIKWLTGGKLSIGKEINTFSLLSRKAVDAFLKIKEVDRHSLYIIDWLGFKSTIIPIVHNKRPHGKSSYTFPMLINHAISGITSQSTRLLSLSIGVGFFAVAASFISIFYLVILHFAQHNNVPGWTSVMVVMLLCTGLILISLGIIGLYLGKVYEQVKERPIYLIDEKLND